MLSAAVSNVECIKCEPRAKVFSNLSSFRQKRYCEMSEDKKVLTVILTDAQCGGHVPLLHHDSVTVGILTYNWLYAEYQLPLAESSLGSRVRHYVEIHRWSAVTRGEPDPEDYRRFHFACLRHRSQQEQQHHSRVLRMHLNANTFDLHRYCLQESSQIQGKFHERQKANEIELVDLTQD